MKGHSIIESFKHAFAGVISAWRSERNMKIHTAAAVLVIVLGILFHLQTWEWFVCIGWIAAVIAGEMINTAIETTVDMAMPDIHPYAKKAKDVAAGAVLILALGAAITGAIIFLPKIFSLFH